MTTRQRILSILGILVGLILIALIGAGVATWLIKAIYDWSFGP